MKARQLLKKLDYLPRWAWYALSFFIAGPFGPVITYVVFHALGKAAQDEEEIPREFDWDVETRGSRRSRRNRASSVYQDADCTVTDDEEVARQWQRTESSAAQAQHAYAQHSAEPAADDASEVGDVIREGYDALRRIRHANDIIADPALSAQIDSIETSCGQILSILEQRPQLLPQLRTFLRYYLPTTLRLLDARAKLERGANTPKAREIRTRIAEAIGVIDKALVRQVEALDEYRFIDLESEMDVLRDMLRADGLIDDEQQEEDDPFAEVLRERGGARRGAAGSGQGDGNVPMATH